MLTIVQISAAVAALVHCLIFVLESVRFADPAVYRRTFRVADTELAAVRSWAFNQGFYNLFLAVGAFVGVGLLRGLPSAGWALLLMSCGSMLAAAVVLVAKDRRFARAAAVQGVFPALALLAALTQL
ncbi:DUF1304 domain-containing protein [Nocardia blacklockiae]|uniref:DUF1304 domain-containing protein n=1 Tax=Nocardia blacklockiae TaxID=480036 RepID=UPI001893F8AB|nr:DUF1304 domain-containing protein [Nocardia blacklockiae]MBF6175008.1 DUF1304 domain-containing protein [Nocardia blacklockiae]